VFANLVNAVECQNSGTQFLNGTKTWFAPPDIPILRRISWIDAGAGNDVVEGWPSRDYIISGTVLLVGGGHKQSGFTYTVGGKTDASRACSTRSISRRARRTWWARLGSRSANST
jgi:hypothetical protein